jgi:DNA-binding NarL/FixJ family response regulator
MKKFASMSVNLAIAEDNRFAREALKSRLSAFMPQLSLKIIAENGKDLIKEMHKDANIDLVLMDLQMPEMGGVEATREVKKRWPQVKILILTMFDDEDNLFNAIMAGASGYLLKEDEGIQLFQSIMDTMAGGAAMSPAIALKALNLVRNPYEPQAPKDQFGLTKREMELLVQLKNGLTYEQIAANLFISYHTVRKHIENIYRKLQVNNKVEAISRAANNNLL